MSDPNAASPASPNLAPPKGVPVPPLPAEPRPKKSRLGLWITLGILLALLIGGLVWYFYNFRASIRPVQLSERERVQLSEKIEAIEAASSSEGSYERGNSPNALPDDVLTETGQVRILDPYEDERVPRDPRAVVLTQRELNGMLNHNTDLGERLQMHLKPGYVDIQLVQPIPEDWAMIGGQTWRFSLDLAINKVRGQELEVMIQNFSVGGIPLPAAWLEMVGIQKNEDFIQMIKKEFPGFEKFEDGIDYVDISSGRMTVRLAE